MKFRYISTLIVALMIMETGCTVKRPTIAHTHIGHALTGWIDTPDKEGLFIVAEKKARQAMESAKLGTSEPIDMARIKQHLKQVIAATNPPQPSDGSGVSYGVKQALSGAIGHLTYAATSDDATSNVRQFVSKFESDAGAVLDRCDLITTLSTDIVNSRSMEESKLLAAEVYKLTQANLFGGDANADGKVGGNPGEFGLKQLRQEIEAMLDREKPPYTAVNQWYLFNLIRLPDGRWIFRNKFGDKNDAYAGGGGGGGY
jgi:hypothetical protein